MIYQSKQKEKKPEKYQFSMSIGANGFYRTGARSHRIEQIEIKRWLRGKQQVRDSKYKLNVIKRLKEINNLIEEIGSTKNTVINRIFFEENF